MLVKLEKKIKRIESTLAILEDLKPDCKKNFLADPIYQGALLHYLYLMADSCVSLAEMVIKRDDLEKPESYHEAIDILGEHKILPPEFAYEFARIASFRNFLAHDYEKVDYLLICEDVLNKLDDIRQYLEFVSIHLGLKD